MIDVQHQEINIVQIDYEQKLKEWMMCFVLEQNQQNVKQSMNLKFLQWIELKVEMVRFSNNVIQQDESKFMLLLK